MTEANALPGTNGVIVEAGTYTLTLAGRDEDAAATGDLDITESLLMYGRGAGSTIIDGAGLDRVFDVDPSAVGAISGINSLTIQHGATLPGGLDDRGGGVLNRGSTNFFFVLVADNEAGLGGGIFNLGRMAVVSSEIRNNRSTAASGAGGGVYSEGDLAIERGTVETNYAVFQGGGVYDAGDFTLWDATVAGNRTEMGGNERGGGIASDGLLRVERSTINGNSSKSGGGIHSSGSYDFINSTISGNTATGSGGGIFNDAGQEGPGTRTLNNVTINANTATTDGGGIFVTSQSSNVLMKNTIVANSIGRPNCAGAATVSEGHNLDSDNTCNLTAAGDLPDRDPLLGPLADNGHLFPEFPHNHTHALLPGSPAIDAGDNSGCHVTDQRSIQRPLDGNGDGAAVCDIGAFEADAVTLTPGPTPGATPVPPVGLPRTGGDSSTATPPPLAAALVTPVLLMGLPWADV